jgi:hypothetical protein
MNGKIFCASLLQLPWKTERKINDRRTWRGKWSCNVNVSCQKRFSFLHKGGRGCLVDNFIRVSKPPHSGYPQYYASVFNRLPPPPPPQPVQSSSNQPVFLLRERYEVCHSRLYLGVCVTMYVSVTAIFRHVEYSHWHMTCSLWWMMVYFRLCLILYFHGGQAVPE